MAHITPTILAVREEISLSTKLNRVPIRPGTDVYKRQVSGSVPNLPCSSRLFHYSTGPQRNQSIFLLFFLHFLSLYGRKNVPKLPASRDAEAAAPLQKQPALLVSLPGQCNHQINQCHCKRNSCPAKQQINKAPVAYTHLDVYKRQGNDWCSNPDQTRTTKKGD